MTVMVAPQNRFQRSGYAFCIVLLPDRVVQGLIDPRTNRLRAGKAIRAIFFQTGKEGQDFTD
ncbi:MAG: hypothetical protein CM1200mP14_19840 [Gammaproteobacteria bacterium]|nr:MAG: hypothetical protein CM1200mP14_19840 [Gammaproteobacteria bacterium]